MTRRLALPAAALALLALPAAPLAAQTPAPEVADIEITGNRALDEAVLRAAILTRETRCKSPLAAPFCALGADWARQKARLDTLQVRRDAARIDSLYAAWGYVDARTTSEIRPLSGGDVVVAFRVTEGEPLVVRSLVVRGVEAVLERITLPDLPLKVGDPYAIPQLEATQRAIARALAEEGYAFTQVEVSGNVSREAKAADVVLEVVPGPRAVFGPATIRAERPLREEDVRERLAFRPGERFRPSLLERTAERLYRLPIVERAEITPRATTATPGDSAVEVMVAVEATRRAGFQAEGIVSQSSCLGGTAWWGSRYFLGAPRVFTVRVGASNLAAGPLGGFCNRGDEEEFADPDYFVRTELRQPLGPVSWLLLDAEVSRESAARAYVRRGVSGRVAFSTQVARGVDALVGYAPERSDNEAGAPFFCGLYGVCGGTALEALTGTATLASAELAASWAPPGARRPAPGARFTWDPLRPRPEWAVAARAEVSAAGAPTGSEFDYTRAVAQGSATRLIGGRVELAARARVGALAGARDPLPPQVRLFGGGPLGVRGVPQNLLGPKLLVLRRDAADDLECALAAGACEGVEIDPDDILLRATGGEALVEAGAEARLWLTRGLQLAAFADFGAVRSGAAEGAPASTRRTESVVTPGIGVLAITPAGPVRVDVAYNPSPARRYPLLARDPDGDDYLYLGDVVYDPFRRGFGSRLQLQLTLGGVF